MKTAFSWKLFNKISVVGIMRNIPLKQAIKIAHIYYEYGLTNLEITMNSPEAMESISSLANTFEGKLNIGAGTVCSSTDLDRALSAGAQFIVTPILNEEVIKKCVANDIAVFPEAYTPTEIYKAWELGTSMVKVFPATKLGPEFIKEVLAPLNQIKLLPTSGVSVSNFDQFIEAGAKGVGIGSQIFPKEIKLRYWYNHLVVYHPCHYGRRSTYNHKAFF